MAPILSYSPPVLIIYYPKELGLLGMLASIINKLCIISKVDIVSISCRPHHFCCHIAIWIAVSYVQSSLSPTKPSFVITNNNS